MTPKELKRLRRSDLLEMLLEMSEENELLRKENQELQKRLDEKEIVITNTGSLAEAALQLSGVFQAAQSACDLYKENIDRMNRKIQQKCEIMDRKTKQKCDAMIAEAQHLARIYMKEIGSDPNKR